MSAQEQLKELLDDEAGDTQSRSKLDETIPLLCEYYQTAFDKPLRAQIKMFFHTNQRRQHGYVSNAPRRNAS